MRQILIFLLVLGLISGMAFAADTEMTKKTLAPESLTSDVASWATLQDGSPYMNFIELPQGYDTILAVSVTVTDVANTSPTLTIVKGYNPPAFRSGMGDLVLDLPATGRYYIGPIETARFSNATGYLWAYATNATGTIAIWKVL